MAFQLPPVSGERLADEALLRLKRQANRAPVSVRCLRFSGIRLTAVSDDPSQCVPVLWFFPGQPAFAAAPPL